VREVVPFCERGIWSRSNSYSTTYTYRDGAAASCDIVNESRANSKRWPGAVKLTRNAQLAAVPSGVFQKSASGR
jgi:hypothetical protein